MDVDYLIIDLLIIASVGFVIGLVCSFLYGFKWGILMGIFGIATFKLIQSFPRKGEQMCK